MVGPSASAMIPLPRNQSHTPQVLSPAHWPAPLPPLPASCALSTKLRCPQWAASGTTLSTRGEGSQSS